MHSQSSARGRAAAEIASVKAAVLAKYPGATVRHIVLEAHGAYRARIVTTDGQRVTVKVSKTFTVIGSHVSGHTKTAAEATALRPDGAARTNLASGR